MFSGRYSLCRSCNARSPSERKITGLVPWGLRRIVSWANHKNNATLPTSNSARTRLFWGLGAALAGLLSHHFLDHIVGRSHKRLDRIHRPHGRHLLLVGLLSLATAMTTRGPALLAPPGRRSRFLDLLDRFAHQRHPFAIGGHHQQRPFLFGGRNRKAVLEHLDIAGLLSVEILRRFDGDLQTENRPQLPNRLGVSVVDHERPQPPLEQVGILSLRQVELGVQGGRFDPVVAVANPLDVDLAEDRQIGTLAGLIQPGKFLVRSEPESPDTVRVGPTSPGPAKSRNASSIHRPITKRSRKTILLDLINGLMLIGGVLQVFDQAPERLESLIDVHRASLLLGGRREIELDGGSVAGQA